MSKEIKELGELEVTTWLKKTGWPTRVTDIDQMIMVYHEWQQTIYMCPETAVYREDILIDMIYTRMRHIHPNPDDARVISAMLVLDAAFLAKSEGVYSPGLTNRLH